MTLAEVARALAPGRPLPPGITDYELSATDIFHPPGNAFPYGVHVATVEVDEFSGGVLRARLVGP